MTTKAVENFLEVCELPNVIDVYSQRKKLVAMVRALQKQVMLDMQPNEELQRIIEGDA